MNKSNGKMDAPVIKNGYEISKDAAGQGLPINLNGQKQPIVPMDVIKEDLEECFDGNIIQQKSEI